MPPSAHPSQQRLASHFAIIELLIKNANSIGVLPERLTPLQLKTPTVVEHQKSSTSNYKKRRSLNRVFNGFRKIVNNIANSTEELDAQSDDDLNKTSKNKNVHDSTFSSCKKRRQTITISDPLPTLDKSENDILKSENNPSSSDFVKIPKSEYEAFKERLTSIESKISKEFHLTKLENIKSETSQRKSQQFEEKLKETLNEVIPMEIDERNTDFLAKRMSRGLNIRKSIELHRSPSARKIGSLKRRRNVSLSRNLSWHLGQEEKDKLVNEVKSPKMKIQIKIGQDEPMIEQPKVEEVSMRVEEPPLKVEKKVPEKPARLKISSIDQSTPAKKPILAPSESWTPATDFFKENPAPSNNDMIFKTPNTKKIMSQKNLQFNSTPKFSTPSAFATPLRNFHANNKSLMMNSLQTPGHDTSQGRESIIVLRNRLNGMVKSKIAALENVGTPMHPLTIVNKNLRNVQPMQSASKADRKQRDSPVRRSPRSISKKSPLKMSDSKFNVLSKNYLSFN